MTTDARTALARRFVRFAQVECRASSPLYERLSLGVADDSELLALAARSRPGQPAPNLLFGAVHRLLRNTPGPLAAWYPSLTDAPPPKEDPYPAFRAFCLAHTGPLTDLLTTRAVQTNEVRRVAVLLPALTVASARGRFRLALIEVGASAGLLLFPDRYGYDYGDGVRAGDPASPVQLACERRGELPPPISATLPMVASRTGIDLNPLSASNPEDVAWLQALVWPEHRERARTLAAALALAAENPPELLAGDALDLLPEVLERVPRDVLPCVFHAHTLNQFSAPARERLTALLDASAKERDIVRIGLGDLRYDGDDALVVMESWHKGERQPARVLAAYDPHGRWIAWRDAATAG